MKDEAPQKPSAEVLALLDEMQSTVLASKGTKADADRRVALQKLIRALCTPPTGPGEASERPLTRDEEGLLIRASKRRATISGEASEPAAGGKVERVAQALKERDTANGVHDPRFARLWYEGAARVAIAALSTPSPPQAPEGWRPIESAPRDGQWFVAYRPEPDFGRWQRVLIVRWHDEIGDFVWPTDTFDIYRDDLDAKDKADFFVDEPYEARGSITHWQPLPAAPQDAAQ